MQSIDRKRERVLELLEKFPALLVVDDIDSLEPESEDAAEFFSLIVPTTKSKVLFTSRRVLFGLGNTTIHVAGLPEPEAREFIRSRCKLLELDENLILPHASKIIVTMESSPLFIEDLLRLCSLFPVKEAIRMWESRKGDEARQYALGREFEMLSDAGKAVLSSLAPGRRCKRRVGTHSVWVDCDGFGLLTIPWVLERRSYSVNVAIAEAATVLPR